MPFSNLDVVAAEVHVLAEHFVAAGHRLYLVGGIVRDLWLDRAIDGDVDIDLTSDARPDEIKAIVGPLADALWLQGERFGTIGAQLDGRAYEITTHRSEAYVAESRKPSVSFSTAIDQDLSRRDFTVNAMAVEVPFVTLTDPYNGAEDLAQRRLRTPLDPEVSFTDDPLRMLRAARFVAGYGLDADPALIVAMTELAERLDIVSIERIRDEFDKLLALENPAAGIELLVETGLLARFAPELHHAGLYERLPHLMELSGGARLRLAGLMVGVPLETVGKRLSALRHSNESRRAILTVLRSVEGLGAATSSPAAFRRWFDESQDHRADARTLVGWLGADGADVVAASIGLEYELRADLATLGPSLTGEEVMESLGIAQGKVIGKALDFLKELRYEQGPLSRVEAREHLIEWWASQR